MNENQPTVAQLACLTAQLASHQVPELTGENGRANLFQWKPPTHVAFELWQQCEWFLSDVPEEKRKALQIDTAQLASLAATLGQGRDLRAEGVRPFIELALRVWEDSRSKLENPSNCQKAILKPLLERLARAPKNPLPFKKMLHQWMPQKRYPERVRLFREFLREDVFSHKSDHEGIPRRNDKESVLAGVQHEFERLNREGITINDPSRYVVRFPLWLDSHSEEQRKIRASKGGQKKAFKGTLRRASQGKAKDQEKVALMYESGTGVMQNSEEARKWKKEVIRQLRHHPARQHSKSTKTVDTD